MHNHMYNKHRTFEWDEWKNIQNILKHHISFDQATKVFSDPRHLIIKDVQHSQVEPRYFCFGQVGPDMLTVRFTTRGQITRIIGAGYWRQGRKRYHAQNNLHRRP